MSARFDVAVVGAGIVGLGAAYAAVRRGLSVVVVDRGAEQSGASIRNFGHICLTPQSGQAREYALTARDVWLELAAEAGFWLRESGTLVAARHDDELALLAAIARERPVAGARGREVQLLGPDAIAARTPVRPGAVVGGALLPYDLQVNPREALASITRHLVARGVDVRLRTAATRIAPGVVETTRGAVEADVVVVAVNHDLDQLLPDLAAAHDVQRCGLDMLRIAPLSRRLDAPLLTGWSLIRYSGFADHPAATAVRERLHGTHPVLAALDLNQMYTQLPDGSLLVGDTHARGPVIPPFQSEDAADELLAATEELFGERPRVRERWQGVYASGADDFLVAELEPGVHVATVTTGIGMTTGLGVAESVIAAAYPRIPARADLPQKEGTP
jgi:FAD dependent oxidoreductase TIGR03364